MKPLWIIMRHADDTDDRPNAESTPDGLGYDENLVDTLLPDISLPARACGRTGIPVPAGNHLQIPRR